MMVCGDMLVLVRTRRTREMCSFVWDGRLVIGQKMVRVLPYELSSLGTAVVCGENVRQTLEQFVFHLLLCK